MKKIETYGIQMNGLRKVAGESKNLNGRVCLEIAYSVEDGRLLTAEHANSNGYSVWADGIYRVATINRSCTMQELADKVHSGLEQLACYVPEISELLAK